MRQFDAVADARYHPLEMIWDSDIDRASGNPAVCFALFSGQSGREPVAAF
jgi:hypothetical protein